MRDAYHPVVTVLMPVFNGQDHLREAVESILGQTLSSFELLVVNDGSTDNTADILESYAAKDERVRIVYQPNAGIVAALNAGLALAKGTYIARMDADDVAHRRRLEIQVDYMEAHPNCVACGSDYELIGAKRGHVVMPHTNEQCKAWLLLQSCFAHPTVVLRSCVLRVNNLCYETDFQYAEDYQLWSKLARFGDFANIRKPLLRYRVHSHQTSISKRQLQRQIHLAICESNLSRYGVSINKNEVSKALWGSDASIKNFMPDMQNAFNVVKKIKDTPLNTLSLSLFICLLPVKSIIKRFLNVMCVFGKKDSKAA